MENMLPYSNHNDAPFLSWSTAGTGVVPCAVGLSSGSVEADDD